MAATSPRRALLRVLVGVRDSNPKGRGEPAAGVGCTVIAIPYRPVVIARCGCTVLSICYRESASRDVDRYVRPRKAAGKGCASPADAPRAAGCPGTDARKSQLASARASACREGIARTEQAEPLMTTFLEEPCESASEDRHIGEPGIRTREGAPVPVPPSDTSPKLFFRAHARPVPDSGRRPGCAGLQLAGTSRKTEPHLRFSRASRMAPWARKMTSQMRRVISKTPVRLASGMWKA